MNLTKKRQKYIYTLVLAATMTSLITVCSWISVPVLSVPFTLQTFAIFTMLLSSGGFIGTISICLYCLLGFIGAPVFAGFTSGPAKLIGPTGGFILGFIVAAIVFLIADKLIPAARGIKDYIRSTILILISNAVMYAFGIIWFMVVYVNDLGNHPSLSTALSACLIPFIIPDLIKIAAAILIGTKLRPFVKKF